jgi:hypothetical protein
MTRLRAEPAMGIAAPPSNEGTDEVEVGCEPVEAAVPDGCGVVPLVGTYAAVAVAARAATTEMMENCMLVFGGVVVVVGR